MKSKFFTLAVLIATAFVLAFSSSNAADPEGQVCTEECVYNSFTGGYEWITNCLPVDPPNPCPGSGNGGNGSGSGSNGSGGGGSGGGWMPKGLIEQLCPSCGGGGGQDDCPCEEKEEEEGEECCEEEGGMPHWWVGEPRINLFVHDKPFWYRASRGPEIAFKLLFKNEPATNIVIDTRQTTIFGVGTNWHTPWRSYVQKSPKGTDRYHLFSGDGSAVEHLAISEPNRHTAALYSFDGTHHYFKYNHGARKVFSPTLSNATTVTLWFLSRIEYPHGVTNRFEYVVTNDAVRLAKVIDVDNRETTFEYTNSGYYSHLISKVIGPHGQAATLTYSNGQLTAIKDMTNLVSTLEYTDTRLSKLVTPYGTNRFDYYAGTGWNGLRVTEHEVRKHFFLFGDGPTDLFPGAAADYESLKNYLTAAGIGETLDNANLHLRNSYSWGPRQYANLSATIRTKLDDATFQITDLSTNEFNKGRTRHWLATEIHASTNRPVGTTLAMERQPSPKTDGSSEGLTIWYDHPNKDSSKRELERNPKGASLKAWKLSGTNWRVIRYVRDINNRITQEKSNYGEPGSAQWKTITYTFSGVDITGVSGAGPENFTRTYNGYHQVLNHYNALNELTLHEYDHLQRITNVTHPNGLITSSTYDVNGNLATVIDRSASETFRTNSYTWTNGLVHTHTDPRGLTTTFVYDVFGRITKQFYPDGTGTTNVYDKLDLVQTADRLGFTNRYEYNTFGELLREIDPLNRTNTYQYCDCGALEQIKDPLGNITRFDYDNAGRQTRVTFPGNTYVDYTYDAANRLEKETDSAEVSITNAFTLNGLIYAVSNAAGRLFYRKLEDDGRVLFQLDDNGVKTAFYYDGLGRLTNRINLKVSSPYPPTSDLDWYSYELFYYTNNIAGPIAYDHVDTFGPSHTTFAYDLLRQKTNETHYEYQGLNPVRTNSYSYWPAGHLRTLTDGKDQTTTWKYDHYGRVTNKVDTLGTNMFHYAYDANGRLTNRWTPAKGNTKYGYDARGNLTSIDYSNSVDITLQYDSNNRVTNMVDAVGATRYSYTGFGALAAEDGPWPNDTVTYTYENGRRRSGLNIQAPNASPWSQSYAYDAANRLTNVTSSAGAFGYLHFTGTDSAIRSSSRLVSRLTLPNGAAITNRYTDGSGAEPLARLLDTRLLHSSGASLNAHTYVYDEKNHRTRQTRGDGSYVDYGYDRLDQLTSTSGKESGGTTNRWHEQFTYEYDAAGNLTTRVQDKLTNSFTLNSLNQFTGGSRSGNATAAGTVTSNATSVTVAVNGGSAVSAIRYVDNTFVRTNLSLLNGTNTFTAVAQDGLGRNDTNTSVAYLPATPTFTYDANGNLTYDGQKALEYDDENQLVRLIATNYWKSEFLYDGNMRRRIRREYTWQNSAWVLTNEVRYVYDRNLEIQWRDNFNLPTLTLTRGIDLSGNLEGAGGIGGLLARSDHSTLNPQPSTAFYFSDGNGNVTALIDANQQVVARYVYEPFGRLLSMSGPLAEANLYSFSSKEHDKLSGSIVYRFRIYDPSLHRWLSYDPIGQLGGLNLYRFVGNEPVTTVDPFGLKGGSGTVPAPRQGRDPTFGWPQRRRPYDPKGPLGDASDIANYEPGHYHIPHHPHHEPEPRCRFGCPPNNCPKHLSAAPSPAPPPPPPPPCLNLSVTSFSGFCAPPHPPAPHPPPYNFLR